MKKNIITYGIIAGIVVSIPMLILVGSVTDKNGLINFENSMLIGYASMILAFSLVFVGIKNYRDQYNDGVIGFGKAFSIGMMIVFIASTLYVAAWLVDYFYFIPHFGEVYASHMIEQLKSSGASDLEIAQKTKEMADFGKMYKNPFFNAAITYMEIVPVGFVITLISSFLLKKEKPVS